PALDAFVPPRRPLEDFARSVLACPPHSPLPGLARCDDPADSLREARRLFPQLAPDARALRAMGPMPLLRDQWTGELLAPGDDASIVASGAHPPVDDAPPPRSARLRRSPDVRSANRDEDEPREPGAWMVQLDTPHEHAEDPFGLQRPADRDEQTDADEFADSVSELAQARLVSTPGRPKEVLLSDDAPASRMKREAQASHDAEAIDYPEWDCRIGGYRTPGARVHCLAAPLGSPQWVERTLAEHRALVDTIRRRFELLRAQRTWLRRRLDGEEIDVDACVQAWSDFRAGRPLAQALYNSLRPARRDLAVLLLVDASGSTDGWISAHRRIVDVEREALLLVCIALDGMGDRYSVQSFSGEGPGGVTVRTIKAFDERYDAGIAQRIAALEPEQYTRAGAALRHATALLMREPATHRLLLLLSDGKPNDVDLYEGRYGIEDMRQAVTEAKVQGVFPFCLTVDRHAASYLPSIFGNGHYALLSRPEALPAVLVRWMKHLASR
ncbi:MAG TPA: VWA domain-containing protein, partial [Zeimonas sp.]